MGGGQRNAKPAVSSGAMVFMSPVQENKAPGRLDALASVAPAGLCSSSQQANLIAVEIAFGESQIPASPWQPNKKSMAPE